MAKKDNIASRVKEAVLPLVEGAGYTLWDVTFYKEVSEWILEVSIDKEEGISTDDCSVVMLVGFEAADNKDGSKKAVTVAEDYTTYVLAVENEKAGFYRKEKGTFYVFNNKAYLDLTEAAQGVRSLTIRFEGDGSTGIENSEFAIQNSEFIYDLMGRRVLNPTKGVYVVGGKKVIIK